MWSYDIENKLNVPTKVRTIRGGIAQRHLLIGDRLRITGNHPVFTTGGWRLAAELTERATMRSFHRGQISTPPIKMIDGTVPVFDLTVDAPHNYFAGGLLVHNKDRAWSASIDDPWHFIWPAKPHAWKTVYEVRTK